MIEPASDEKAIRAYLESQGMEEFKLSARAQLAEPVDVRTFVARVEADRVYRRPSALTPVTINYVTKPSTLDGKTNATLHAVVWQHSPASMARVYEDGHVLVARAASVHQVYRSVNRVVTMLDHVLGREVSATSICVHRVRAQRRLGACIDLLKFSEVSLPRSLVGMRNGTVTKIYIDLTRSLAGTSGTSLNTKLIAMHANGTVTFDCGNYVDLDLMNGELNRLLDKYLLLPQDDVVDFINRSLANIMLDEEEDDE